MTYRIKLRDLPRGTYDVLRRPPRPAALDWTALSVECRYDHLPVREVRVPRDGVQGPPHPMRGRSGPYWVEWEGRVAWDPVDRVLYVHWPRCERLGARAELAAVADRIVDALDGGCWRGA